MTSHHDVRVQTLKICRLWFQSRFQTSFPYFDQVLLTVKGNWWTENTRCHSLNSFLLLTTFSICTSKHLQRCVYHSFRWITSCTAKWWSCSWITMMKQEINIGFPSLSIFSKQEVLTKDNNMSFKMFSYKNIF